MSRSSSTRLLPDTNVLVYETIEDSPHHELAARLVEDANELVIPLIVLYEYAWVMTRKLGLDARLVAEKIEEYLGDPRVTLVCEPHSLLPEALRVLAAHAAPVTELNDYVIILCAKRYGATLATFDERLKKRAARLGVKTLP